MLPPPTYRPVSVGGCGNSARITTVRGGTLADPCPNSGFGTGAWCNEFDTESWVDSYLLLNEHLKQSWQLLVQTETGRGVSVEQNRLGSTYQSLEQRVDSLMTKDDVASFLYQQNTAGVGTIQAWMVDADCLLTDIDNAIRMYQVQPPPSPTPGPSPTPTPGPDTPPPLPPSTSNSSSSSSLGDKAMVALGIGLLGGALYYISRGSSVSLGGGPKRPLPRAK